MIFQTRIAKPVAASATPVARRQLQRKCACGGKSEADGECAQCRQKRGATKSGTQLQRQLAINQPNDRFEKEADRMAERVVNGGAKGPRLSSAPNESLQRDDDEKKPPAPNNYGDAAKKVGDALQETDVGKQLKAKAEAMGKQFLSSVEGKVIAASALGGTLAALIATNSKLPVGIPEIPLDFIKPGLKAKITYEGPMQKPTNVGLTLTSKGGVSVAASYTKTEGTPGKPAEEKAGLTLSIPLGGSSEKKKPGSSESDKIASDTARLRAEQAQLREATKTPGEKAADEDFMKSYLHFKANDPLNPLNIGKKKEDLLMRSATGGTGPATAPPVVHDVLAESGQPLDSGTRAAMEESLGYDFGRVRIHSDARAAESARAVAANAYTVGNQIAFASGRYAPGTADGRRLLAHELAHVMQQSGAEPRVQRETYYGGGYKQFYNSVDEEIAAGQKKPSEWHPATPDMAATAAGSGGGESVSTIDDLLKKIEGKGKGSITRLNLIGHSNSRVFSFGGKITKDNVNFSEDAALYSQSLADNAARLAALRDRFAPGAKIVLYSCDAGSGQGLLDAVGDGFGVCVEGLTTEIWWCLTKSKNQAVRGHIWAQNPNDPLPADHPPPCETLSSDVTSLTTGGKSKQCGAKKAAP